MTASPLTSLQASSSAQLKQSTKPQTRAGHSASHSKHTARPVRALAQGNRDAHKQESRVQATAGNAAMKLLSAMAAAQLALSGAAVAGINDPVLPGAKVTSKDLPDGPKPLDALSGAGGGNIAGKAASAVSSASDKAGQNTPDVNVPGFGPFKFNPKEDAKQAAKKSPIGFLTSNGLASAPALTMQIADLPRLPGSNVSKGDLPDGPKPLSGDAGNKAASAVSKASDKAGQNTPDVNVPGFGPFKFNPKEDAKQAAKKSPLGFLQANKMFLADLPSLPGSNVSKSDLPNGPKPLSGDAGNKAASAVSKASDKAGQNTPDVNVPGFGPFKFNPKEDAKQAAKKSPFGLMQANKMFLADLPSLPGSNVSKSDLPDGPKPLSGDAGSKAASAVSKASDKAGQNTPDVNVPGFGPFKFNPKEDAKQAAKKSPLGFMQIGELAFDLPSLPGSNVSKDDLPDGPKPLAGKLDVGGGDSAGQAASAASNLSDKAGEATPDVNIPGFGPFKGNPKEDAKQAGKKASELTSSAKSSLGYMHIGELAFDLPSLPGSNVKKTDLPDGPKPLSGTLDIGGGSDIAGQAASAASSLSDKAGESTPDVDLLGFGPFKGNPKEDAKQAANKASELTSSINTPDVSSGIGQATSAASDVKNDIQEAVNQKGLE